MDIFVFGSNLAGRHGKGAALCAKMFYGAIQGRGEGIQGNSYAIPTKDVYLNVLMLEDIEVNVHTFLIFTRENKEQRFYVTAIGTGLAGYGHGDIGPMFASAPSNCILPVEWETFRRVANS